MCCVVLLQTTMLKGETQEIGKMLERTMMAKFGPAELNNHFMLMDTICDATQASAAHQCPQSLSAWWLCCIQAATAMTEAGV